MKFRQIHAPVRVVAFAVPLFFAQAAYTAALLEEITVSAQKRDENLQQVPIAISAFSTSTIRDLGARSLTDLGKFTPGAEMHNDSSTQPEYSIRGIHTTDFTVGSEPAVAVYVDGIYSARGAGAELIFNDLERVEILKGPQGTLFGRNATGGAIHLVTHKPVQETSGSATLSIGNYQQRNVDFVYNTPLTDTIAMRVSGAINRRNGYLNNLTGADMNSVDDQNLRLSLRWQPNDRTDVIWRADYSHMDQNSGAVYTTTGSVYAAGGVNEPFDPFGDIAVDLDSVEQRELFGTSLEIQHDFEHFRLTSLTGYRSMNAGFINDEDGSADIQHRFHSNNTDDQDQLSQEFRFSGETERMQWTLGAVYNREHVDHTTLTEYNYTTFETFALYQGALANPALVGLGPDAEPFAIAERTNLIRSLNQAGANPAFNGTLFPAGYNIDGLFISSFLVGSSYYGSPQNFQLNNILVPAAVASGCGLPASDTNLLAVMGATSPSTAIGCAVLPMIQARLTEDPWQETVRNTGTFESSALYGDFTYALTKKLNLSAGARYTYDRKEFTIATGYNPNNYFFNDTNGDPLLVGFSFYADGVNHNFVPVKYKDNWDAVSGRLVLDYSLSEAAMVYGSVASGFKSGGFNSLNIGSGIDPSFDEETVISYELGIKSDWLDGQLRFNAATYFYEYDNKQDLILAGEPVATYYVALVDARGSGAELELMWQATDRWLLGANYSYLDTEITNDHSAAITSQDRSGQPLADTPQHKINLVAQYTLPLSDLGALVTRVDGNWTDDRLSQVSYQAVDDYQLWNARATFTPTGNRWALSAWVNNLTDEEIIGGYIGPASAIGSHTVWRMPPRMYGVDLSMRF